MKEKSGKLYEFRAIDPETGQFVTKRFNCADDGECSRLSIEMRACGYTNLSAVQVGEVKMFDNNQPV